jgi:hypothetical protein
MPSPHAPRQRYLSLKDSLIFAVFNKSHLTFFTHLPQKQKLADTKE